MLYHDTMNTPFSEIPRLQWVLVEGKLCHVSEFRNLPPRARPEAHCPICERRVTLKLGQIRAHHFAHQPEDVCFASQPETALHLNCKFHIYRQLLTARKLDTTISCRGCGKQKQLLWKQDWDAVEVEYKMNSLRPDIALLQNGRVIGAIEILVTHSVGEQKALVLQALEVDWIEVDGCEAIYTEPDAWTAKAPLVTRRQYPKLAAWICSECEKVEAQEQFKRSNRVDILFARMIDLYFRSGKKYRQVFYVKRELTNGETTRIWIEDGDWRILADERAPINEQSQARLNTTFMRKYQALTEKAAIVDGEMSWVRWLPGRKFFVRDIDNFPFRYSWHENTREWVLQPGLRWKSLQ